MLNILNKNAQLSDALISDSNSVEITRLTKRNMSEEEIRSYKYGVSYRIGVREELFDILNDGSVFAPHWEIRKWFDKDNKRPANVDARTDTSIMRDVNRPNNFLSDENAQMIDIMD